MANGAGDFGPDGVFYYLCDAQGNVIGIIDEDGNADWYSYDPYGQTISEPAMPKYNPFRYKGAYQDIVNGKELYYMTFRYYDPEYGRFTQIDPIGTLSDFTFAANNPIMMSDPSGLEAECAEGEVPFDQWVERLDGSGEYDVKTNCGPKSVTPAGSSSSRGCISIDGFRLSSLSIIIQFGEGRFCPTFDGARAVAPFIIVGQDPKTEHELQCLLQHEDAHIWQQRVLGGGFWTMYPIGNAVFGHRNNPLEKRTIDTQVTCLGR